MASENKTRASNSQKQANREVQLHPELLMAARDGSWELLSDLLNKEDAPAVPIVVVDVEAEETTANMDVDKAAHATEEATTIGLDSILHVVAPPMPIVVVDVEAEETTANINVDKAAHPTEEAAIIELDSILHVVASSGDDEDFLKSADVIYGWAKHLLDARNKKGDTPLQCAVRAGNIEMVRHLIGLARHEDDRDARVKAVLRNQNEQGETALHEALRLADKKMVDEMVEVLVREDAELARLVHANGTSPLYLAVMLGHNGIAEKLYRKDKELSYSGPYGQNVLHVAVLRSKDMTCSLVKWNKDLIKQQDSDGSTPMHLAASAEDPSLEFFLFVFLERTLEFYSFGFYLAPHKCLAKFYRWMNLSLYQLVRADQSSAFQRDKDGLFPVHAAAWAGSMVAIIILLTECPGCAGLRDANGRTFLHVAVVKKRLNIVKFVCLRPQTFQSVLNIQDNDGNTALHLAISGGELDIFKSLIGNRHVLINLPNKEGETPMDLSRSMYRSGFYFGMHAQRRILGTMTFVNAQSGIRRRDRVKEFDLNEDEESKKITEFAQVVGIGSVLVATATFAAAFTMPGGFRTESPDDHKYAGTPMLAGKYAFNGFVISNTLAFICSALATFSLVYCGVAAVDIQKRIRLVSFSLALLISSARSFCAAFAFALYLLLDPVAHGTAIASCLMTSLALLDCLWFMLAIFSDTTVVLNRRVSLALLKLGTGFLVNMVYLFWPYVVIFGLLANTKIITVTQKMG